MKKRPHKNHLNFLAVVGLGGNEPIRTVKQVNVTQYSQSSRTITVVSDSLSRGIRAELMWPDSLRITRPCPW
jgi:hypothetical protein